MQAIETVEREERLKRPNLWRQILLLLSVVGPGLITGNLDNDAGGISTYSQAGAQFGYGFLWLLIPMTVALIVVQEICVRLGVITGKGLGDLIRERFGVRVTLFVMIALLFANLLTTVAEFAGVAASADIFHWSRYLAVPLAAIFVAVLVLFADYKWVEKVFLMACAVYLSYVLSGLLSKPDWHEVVHATFVPHLEWTKAYMLMFLAVVGTTITPWMQFYIQSSVVEKGVKPKELRYSQIDVISGCLITDIISYFIILACGATLFVAGKTDIQFASDAAIALKPLAGQFAGALFAVGLLNASLFTASVLPLSTAYTICEAMGFESGVNHKFKDAPIFFSIYLGLIAVGAITVLFLHVSLIAVMTYSQVFAGVLLPVIVIAMLALVNDKVLMGKHVNGPVFNAIAWATAAVTIGATLGLLITTIFHIG
jgi:NRAMP (natural resistance-associated macrophage protein)-like metal ion transporter